MLPSFCHPDGSMKLFPPIHLSDSSSSSSLLSPTNSIWSRRPEEFLDEPTNASSSDFVKARSSSLDVLSLLGGGGGGSGGGEAEASRVESISGPFSPSSNNRDSTSANDMYDSHTQPMSSSGFLHNSQLDPKCQPFSPSSASSTAHRPADLGVSSSTITLLDPDQQLASILKDIRMDDYSMNDRLR